MSVSMTKGEGVTVFTVASNPKSKWPLLCQMLGTLCYSPVCSLSLGLRKLQGNSQSALGAIQIMAGLLHIGFGAILICTQSSSWQLQYNRAPFWLGGVSIAVGFMCILAERFPSPCLVGITVLMNMAGAGVAIAGIVLYSIELHHGDWMFDNGVTWLCSRRDYDYHMTNPPQTVEIDPYLEKCKHLKWIAVTLVNGIEIVLMVLTILQLCVTTSSAVLSIKALCRDGEEENKSQDPELYDPLLEDVTADTTTA